MIGGVAHTHRAGELSSGMQAKTLRRYRAAHAAFGRGDFRDALARYTALNRQLAPHFAAIVKRNMLELNVGDLTDEQAQRALAGRITSRLDFSTREGITASLCSAVAHDIALIARHLAEGTQKGRDPEVAEAIIKGFAHAIAVAPHNPINYHNLAGYEDYLGRDRDACQHYEIALRINQNQWESWISWGHALGRLGDLEGAEQCWANALAINDALDLQKRERRWAVAMLRLMKGDYARGWDDYEARLTFPPYLDKHGRPDLIEPLWDGKPMTGTLYLHLEQGIGDALQMTRYVPWVKARVGRLVIEVINALVPLFQEMFPDIEIWEKTVNPPAHDAQLPMFSLPHLHGTTLETIPEPVPFQVKSAEDVPIQAEPGRIGLCWKGSATHPNDLIRSMPFEECAPLLDLRQFTWQSLQFGYDTSEPLIPMPVGDFLETARQIARCSLVITVDTSVAHLAGCLGVPTWLLLPHIAEWRWLQERDDTPWYPSMRLWRQSKPGDWAELVARVANGLNQGAS
jgi:tetratricopeptide (TPR) repeat protein